MAFTDITVTRTYQGLDGAPARGSVLFELLSQMVDASTLAAVPPFVERVQLVGGALTVVLPATTDPTTTPDGVTYRVTEFIQDASQNVYEIAVPHTAPGGTADLGTLAPVAGDGAIYLQRMPFDVRAYGAVCDGVTNDLVPLQAAIDDCFDAGGGVVDVPVFGTARVSFVLGNWDGTYAEYPGLLVRRGVILRGLGKRLTTIKGLGSIVNGFAGTGSTNMIHVQGALTADGVGGALEDLTIDGDRDSITRTNYAGHMVRVTTGLAATHLTEYSYNVAFRNVRFQHSHSDIKEGFAAMLKIVDGVELRDVEFVDNDGTGLATSPALAVWGDAGRKPARNVRGSNVRCDRNGWAGTSFYHAEDCEIWGYSAADNKKVMENAVNPASPTYQEVNGVGVNFEWAERITLHDVTITGSGKRGVSFTGYNDQIRVYAGRLENNQVYGLDGNGNGDGGEITAGQGSDSASPIAQVGALSGLVEFHGVTIEPTAGLPHVRTTPAVITDPLTQVIVEPGMPRLLFNACPGIEDYTWSTGAAGEPANVIPARIEVPGLQAQAIVNLPLLSARTSGGASGTPVAGLTVAGNRNPGNVQRFGSGSTASGGRRFTVVPILHGTTQTGLWAYRARVQLLFATGFDLGFRDNAAGVIYQMVRLPADAGTGEWFDILAIWRAPGTTTEVAATIYARDTAAQLYVDYDYLMLLDGYGAPLP